MSDAVLIFHSIHKVMLAEKVLKAEGFDVRLVPVPRQLSSDCGLSITFRWVDLDPVTQGLDEAGCPPAEVYRAVGAETYERFG